MESETHRGALLARFPYPLVCALLGLAVGWLPSLAHGPIRHKFDILYMNGGTVVVAFILARLSIGWWVGVGTWPSGWLVRGPLTGLLVMLPISLIALATPGCGFP